MHDGRLHVQAGAGIVCDSDPEKDTTPHLFRTASYCSRAQLKSSLASSLLMVLKPSDGRTSCWVHLSQGDCSGLPFGSAVAACETSALIIVLRYLRSRWDDGDCTHADKAPCSGSFSRS
ncbi:MAG: hypothetical protein WKF61_00850 [Luteimonas sp.]